MGRGGTMGQPSEAARALLLPHFACIASLCVNESALLCTSSIAVPLVSLLVVILVVVIEVPHRAVQVLVTVVVAAKAASGHQLPRSSLATALRVGRPCRSCCCTGAA